MKDFFVYTDKPTDFDFKVEVEGASLSEAKARLILSGEKANYIVEGTVGKDGSAKIEIPKLKGLVEDSSVGTMDLEVIVEDAYFSPWSGTYRVTASKKVTVNEIAQQKQPSKPAISVIVKENKSPYQKKIDQIAEDLRNREITSRNILSKQNKKYLYSLMEVTFNKSLQDLDNNVIISDIINTIAEG